MTPANRPRFVDNLPAAFIAVCLTAFACHAAVRALIRPQPLRGPVSLIQFPAGTFAAVVVGSNILLESIFAALIVGVALSVSGWERVLVVFYSSLLFLTQFAHLLPGLTMLIRWTKVLCALISLTAALALLVTVKKSRRPPPASIETR